VSGPLRVTEARTQTLVLLRTWARELFTPTGTCLLPLVPAGQANVEMVLYVPPCVDATLRVKVAAAAGGMSMLITQ
jgi:hypothetical protein